jgi:hypothetical protein
MTPAGLIYQDEALYDAWVRLALGALIAIMLVSGIALLFIDTEGAYVMLAGAIFISLLFWAILPRRYQVFEDHVRIVLGGPFAWTIPLKDIKSIGPASTRKGFIYWGVRFVTSLAGVVEITRRHGLDVVFSPAHPDMFIEQANRARDLLPAG